MGVYSDLVASFLTRFLGVGAGAGLLALRFALAFGFGVSGFSDLTFWRRVSRRSGTSNNVYVLESLSEPW
jgi:hypothetical protein